MVLALVLPALCSGTDSTSTSIVCASSLIRRVRQHRYRGLPGHSALSPAASYRTSLHSLSPSPMPARRRQSQSSLHTNVGARLAMYHAVPAPDDIHTYSIYIPCIICRRYPARAASANPAHRIVARRALTPCAALRLLTAAGTSATLMSRFPNAASTNNPSAPSHPVFAKSAVTYILLLRASPLPGRHAHSVSYVPEHSWLPRCCVYLDPHIPATTLFLFLVFLSFVCSSASNATAITRYGNTYLQQILPGFLP